MISYTCDTDLYETIGPISAISRIFTHQDEQTHAHQVLKSPKSLNLK